MFFQDKVCANAFQCVTHDMPDPGSALDQQDLFSVHKKLIEHRLCHCRPAYSSLERARGLLCCVSFRRNCAVRLAKDHPEQCTRGAPQRFSRTFSRLCLIHYPRMGTRKATDEPSFEDAMDR